MTREEFQTALKAAAGKSAYNNFKDKQNPPYALFGLPDSDVTYGDNVHYYEVPNGWVELYTDAYNSEMMGRVEQIFIDNGLPWNKENEAWLQSEELFYARWSFQLI